MRRVLRHPGTRLGPVVVVAVAVLASGCGGGPDPELVSAPITAPATTPEEPAGEDEVVLLADFEDVTGPLQDGAAVTDASGNHTPGSVRLGGDAPVPLESVSSGDGTALQFPPPCEGDGCPKAVLELTGTELLNPGTADFRYGAGLLLEADQTADGSNVVQKGFNNGGASQWKLQVDGDKGRPSCVLVGEDGRQVLVTSQVGVADGTWHDVACVRADGVLTVVVDGVAGRSKPVPADLAVRPPADVRIAGKSVKPGNDQFHGAIDDVFVAVSPG